MTTLTIEAVPSSGSQVVLNALPAGMSVFYLGRDGLQDWDSVPDSKSEVRERSQADGAFGISHDFYESLVFSVLGWYNGADRADASAAKRFLRGAIARGRPSRVTLDDVDGQFSRIASMRHLSIPPSGPSPVFNFAIDFVATDPLMYGEEIVFPPANVPVSGGGLVFPLGTNPTEFWDFGADGTSGLTTVTNSGTAEVYPDIEVTGGLGAGFIATDITLVRSVRLDRVIPLGSTVSVNQRTGRAYLDGPNDVPLTDLDFFSIGPGETHVIQFSPLGAVTGTPQLTLRFRPAY